MAKRKSSVDWGQVATVGIIGGVGLIVLYGYGKWVQNGSQGNPVTGTLTSAGGIIVNPIENTLNTAGEIIGGGVGSVAAYKVGQGVVNSNIGNLGTTIGDWFGSLGDSLSGVASDAANITAEHL
jgi:hypothetical protein